MNFGFDAITQETPIWAKWVFRIVFLLTTVATFVIAADPAIADDLKVRLTVYLKALDMIVFGLSKLFGIELKKPENE
jgi:hypothetical protein